MYQTTSFTGAGLPPKTICLTYDDGPGPFTKEIAEFLYSNNIQATFFVVGKYAYHYQNVLSKLKQLQHLVGNHTYDHPDLPYYVAINGDIQDQILRTDTIIKQYIDSDITYFRSPYGKWSKEVAEELNSNILTSLNHVGPVYWDIGGIDCYYWKNEYSIEDAVQKYLTDITEKDHGIIVMHDDIADMDHVKFKNNTLELTKRLIPKLLELGYKFIRLDEVASIKQASNEKLKFALKGSNNEYVSLTDINAYTLTTNGKLSNPLTYLEGYNLGYGKFGFKALNGLYINFPNDSQEEILANGERLNDQVAFDLIPINSGQFVLRAANGYYIARENKKGGRLMASSPYMRNSERFTFTPFNIPPQKVSFKNRLKAIRKQFLYIKSKVQAHQ